MRRWTDGVIAFFGILATLLALVAAVTGVIAFLNEVVDGDKPANPGDGQLKSGWLFLAAGGLFVGAALLRRWSRVRSGRPDRS
ncbi:hypothetical protein EV382_3519 [Micromonospora violae]|uniref:Uncharacterized protein n=1 Tax=Micromonospora violae TaxID=1278207 RepID=A0A4Q7UKZ6_9ACTN|nr:hypothetical protein [Micromonospora violae]RZT80273.1 hypothetical protein EV382_3519 [Micromonospora violae]